MIRIKNKKNTGKIYYAFLICLGLVVGLFGYRVASRNTITPMSDGQIIMKSKQYQFGAVYDRNDELIVCGEANGVSWESESARQSFEKLLGIDIEDSLNSRITLCGNAPWLFGAEDNRFSIYDLIHPNAARCGGSVRLTIDKNLQEYVNDYINNLGYEDVYIVISNYETGEILALYGNVFKDEMHPGSTLKPILAASALSVDSNAKGFVYNCTNENHNFMTESGLFRINCVGGTTHGQMTMEDGLANSCNGYFISLIQQVDKEKLIEELKKWGFDDVVYYSQFMYWDHSFLGNGYEDSDYLMAAIGQANAYITPAGLNFCTNSLLNHGILVEPIWFSHKKVSPTDEWTMVNTSQNVKTVCLAENADTVVQMMQEVTSRGTGQSFYLPGFAAKTGTAQKSDDDGGLTDLYTVWTTGGLVNEETPYSITVCLDNVSADVTSSDAGKVAQQLLLYMMEGEK